MRHLWSLLAGLVAAPLAWLFLATGQHRSRRTVARWYAEAGFDTTDLVGPVVFLAGAGVILGVLGTLRFSPLGPAVAGLLLVAPTGFVFRDPFRTFDAVSLDPAPFDPVTAADAPRRLLGQDLHLWLPVENGTLLVLGALLLMAVFSRHRWRRRPAPGDAGAPAAPWAAGVGGPGAGGPGATGGPAAAATAPTPRLPVTDDEILAAAAAMEAEEAARTAPPPAPGSDTPTASPGAVADGDGGGPTTDGPR